MITSLPYETRTRFDSAIVISEQLDRALNSPVALVAGDDALRSSIKFLLSVVAMQTREYRSIQAYLADEHNNVCGCLVVDSPTRDAAVRGAFLDLLQRDDRSPVIAMTTAPETLAVAAAGRPHFRVVGKPFESEHLIGTIRTLQASYTNGDETQAAPRAEPSVKA